MDEWFAMSQFELFCRQISLFVVFDGWTEPVYGQSWPFFRDLGQHRRVHHFAGYLTCLPFRHFSLRRALIHTPCEQGAIPLCVSEKWRLYDVFASTRLVFKFAGHGLRNPVPVGELVLFVPGSHPLDPLIPAATHH
jgi:hypothetical protein